MGRAAFPPVHLKLYEWRSLSASSRGREANDAQSGSGPAAARQPLDPIGPMILPHHTIISKAARQRRLNAQSPSQRSDGDCALSRGYPIASEPSGNDQGPILYWRDRALA
jgi:hypothetical protein